MSQNKTLEIKNARLVDWHNIRLPSGKNGFDSHTLLIRLSGAMAARGLGKTETVVRFPLFGSNALVGQWQTTSSVKTEFQFESEP